MAEVPEGVRPTAARVREALFSVVGQRLGGSTFLDAFAGSGAVGLEAWSRGAEVTCLELRRPCLRAIRANAAALGAVITVVEGDALGMAAIGTFDGVFADPPYAADPVAVAGRLGPLARGFLVVESDGRVDPPEAAGALGLARVHRYGGTTLWVYRPST